MGRAQLHSALAAATPHWHRVGPHAQAGAGQVSTSLSLRRPDPYTHPPTHTHSRYLAGIGILQSSRLVRAVANLVLRITKPPQPVCITFDEQKVDRFARTITAVTVLPETGHGKPHERCEAADESVSTAVAVGLAVAAVVMVVGARSGAGGSGGSATPSAPPRAPEGLGGGGGSGSDA